MSDVQRQTPGKLKSRGSLTPSDGLVLLVGLAAAALILLPLTSLFAELVFDIGVGQVLRDTLNQPRLGELLVNTALLVVISGVVALALATALAWVNERTDAGLGFVGRVLPVLPLFVMPVAGAIGWTALLSPRAGYANALVRRVISDNSGEGPFSIYTWYGLLGLYVIYLLPQAYLLIAPAIRQLDPGLEAAAVVSGASSMRTFISVVVPAVRPALAAAWTLVTIFGLILYSVPVIIGANAGVEVLSVRIVRLLTVFFPPQTPAAIGLSGFMIVVVVAAFVVQRRVNAGQRHAMLGSRQSGGSVRVHLSRRVRWLVRGVMMSYIMATIVAPVAGLLLLSTQPFWSPNVDWGGLSWENYRAMLSGAGRTLESLMFSMRMAAITAIVTLLLGLVVSFWARVSDGALRRFSTISQNVLRLPALVSHMVLALAILVTFAGPPFLLGGSVTILLLAYMSIYFPHASVSADSALSQVGDDLLEAGEVSGATRIRTFRSIAVPLVAPSLVGGAAIVFAFVIGDLTATQILAGTRTPALGFVLLGLYENGTYGQLAALAVVACCVNTALIGFAIGYASRRQSKQRRQRQFGAAVLRYTQRIAGGARPSGSASKG